MTSSQEFFTVRDTLARYGIWRATLKNFPQEFSAYALPGAIPHVLVNEEPGSSRMRTSPLRNAFGGHVIGSTARLRRLKFGRESPLKIMKYG
jgi:hypothetical protein